MRTLKTLLVLSLFHVAACAGTDEAADARDGTFGGKADGFGISEGSPEARGVLRVANELSWDQLTEDAGVAALSASAIEDVRDGDDDQLGTGDDAVIATLAELDAIPFVGEKAFGKLLAYAQANGYIEEAEEASLLLSYRYGTVSSYSQITIRTDGRYEHVEQRSPSEPAEIKTELFPESGVNDLRQLIFLAGQGSIETRVGPPATVGAATGEFVVYAEDGAELPIQLIEADQDGDTYLDVTFNTSIGADELLNVVHAEAERDMPR